MFLSNSAFQHGVVKVFPTTSNHFLDSLVKYKKSFAVSEVFKSELRLESNSIELNFLNK